VSKDYSHLSPLSCDTPDFSKTHRNDTPEFTGKVCAGLAGIGRDEIRTYTVIATYYSKPSTNNKPPDSTGGGFTDDVAIMNGGK